MGVNIALGTSGNQIYVSQAPAFTSVNGGNILAYATVSNSGTGSVDFASFSSASNGNPGYIGPFTSYVTSVANSTNSGNVVKLTQSEGLSTSKTIAALLLPGGITLSQGAGDTLTIGSGGIVATGSNTIIGGALALGAEGVINTTASSTTTINSTIGGSSALTIGGAGGLVLPTANSYSSTTTLNSGVLLVGNASSTGNGTLVLTGGSLASSSAVTLINTTINLNNGNVTIGSICQQQSDFQRHTQPTLADNNVPANTLANTISIAGLGLITFGAIHGGAGAGLILVGPGMAAITGNNTGLTGGNVYLNGASIIADNNGAFGTDTLTLTSGTLLASSVGNTLSNTIIINGNTSLGGSAFGGNSASGSTLTLGNGSSSITVASSSTFTVADSASVTVGGVVGGPGALTQGGLGTLILGNASNTLQGGIILNATTGGVDTFGAVGTLAISAAGDLGMGLLTLTNGNLNSTSTTPLTNQQIVTAGYLGFTGQAPAFSNPLGDQRTDDRQLGSLSSTRPLPSTRRLPVPEACLSSAAPAR